MEKKIENYIEWFRVDCSNPNRELKWLINLVIDSGGKQKDEMIQVLEDNYNWCKSNK